MHVHSGGSDMCLQRGRPISKWTAHGKQTWYEGLVTFSIRCADAAGVDTRHQTTDDRKRRLAKSDDQLHSRPSPLLHPFACDTALVLLWWRDVRREPYCCECISYFTHESESDRARVRFSDLLMCANLTDLRFTNRLTIKNFCASQS